MFISFGLFITVTTNVISANYLDVNFDLTTDIYKPCRKPNDESFYTNKHSNHPHLSPPSLFPKHCTTNSIISKFKNLQYFFKSVNI